MWPWEHAAFAYLAFSVLCRAVWRRTPRTRAAVVATAAGVLPDLVDKPLSWWLTVLPSGRSLAHSLLVLAPIFAVVLLVGWATDERPVAVAFVVGYLTHLAGDGVDPLVVEGEWRGGFLLWPVVPAPEGAAGGGLPHLRELVDAFVQFLATPRGTAYLFAEVVFLALVAALWLYDGYPGMRWLHSRSRDTTDD